MSVSFIDIETLESVDFGGFVPCFGSQTQGKNAVMVEKSGRAEPIHEGMVQGSSFPREASKKIESYAKSATEVMRVGSLNGEGMEFFILECQKELNEMCELCKGLGFAL